MTVIKEWNGSQWVPIVVGKQGPAGAGAPAGGVTNDLIVKQSATNYDVAWADEITIDQLNLDTTAAESLTAAGQLAWDDTSGTLAMVLKGNNVTAQIGETVFCRVVNDTGSTLTKGQVVYLSGSSGQKVEVALARADSDTTSARTFGVVAESISNAQSGFVITQGLLQGIDTNALTQGAIVWVSPTTAGGLTTTKPTAPDHLVMVGVCVNQASGTAGSLFVKVQNGYELDEIHDVKYTSLATGDLLTRTSSNLWENITRGNVAADQENILAVQVFS